MSSKQVVTQYILDRLEKQAPPLKVPIDTIAWDTSVDLSKIRSAMGKHVVTELEQLGYILVLDRKSSTYCIMLQ